MIYRRCIRTFLIFAGLLCWPAIRSHAQQLTLYAGWENPGHLTLENVQSGLKGSGVYGIRFAHNTEAFVTGLAITKP